MLSLFSFLLRVIVVSLNPLIIVSIFSLRFFSSRSSTLLHSIFKFSAYSRDGDRLGRILTRESSLHYFTFIPQSSSSAYSTFSSSSSSSSSSSPSFSSRPFLPLIRDEATLCPFVPLPDRSFPTSLSFF